MTDRLVSQATPQILLQDLRRMIEEARQGVASTVNNALSVLCRLAGNRINQCLNENSPSSGMIFIHTQHTVRYTATNPARFEKLWG